MPFLRSNFIIEHSAQLKFERVILVLNRARIEFQWNSKVTLFECENVYLISPSPRQDLDTTSLKYHATCEFQLHKR